MKDVSPLRALVFGSAMVDTIAVIADGDIELITMHNEQSSYLLLEQGRKVDAESVTSHIGGGAANVSVSMARLGVMVEIAAVVGDDLGAGKIREKMQGEGVGLNHLAVDRAHTTGTSVLVSSHDQDAAIFTSRGANKFLTPAHIAAIDFSKFDLVYIASLSDASAACFGDIVQRAKAAGAYVAVNPGIRQLTARAEEFLSACPFIDQMSLNKVELTALLPFLVHGRGSAPKWQNHIESPAPKLLEEGLRLSGMVLGLGNVMARLSALGPTAICLTDGKYGAYLMENSELYYGPPVPVIPRGSAGAGDAFSSTLAAELACGKAAEAALLAAALNAASVVGETDTQAGLLGARELQKRMQTHRKLKA